MKYPVSLKKLVIYAVKSSNKKVYYNEINKITNDLIKAGFNKEVSKESCNYVIRAVLDICKLRYNPLTASKITASTKTMSCPLCLTRPIDIELASGRKAKYCLEHNVAIPCSV